MYDDEWFREVVDDAAESYRTTPEWAKPVVVVHPAQAAGREVGRAPSPSLGQSPEASSPE